ncbi:hydroxyisourate hydrolase [Kushneria konosiri]|nr:hydroxyisourate hydrolase [Kushneria konosiri]
MTMTTLSTHVLDQHGGLPAAGLHVDLFAHGATTACAHGVTNQDGRLDAPLLENGEGGHYTLHFHVRDYFLARGVDSPFLDRVPVSVTLANGQRYHVPLLITPWGYNVYRGS